MLIFKNDKIVVQTILQKYIVNWYHTYILHLGTERTEANISQHWYWPNLKDDIRIHIKVCDTFQKNRKQKFKHGKVSATEAEAIPRDRLLVDIIVPYKIRGKGHDKPLVLKSLTTIDPETGWFEIVQYNDKQAVKIEKPAEKTWLYRYPLPTIVTYGRGNELLAHAFKNDIDNEYRVESKCETTAYPKANSILEIIHQITANLKWMFDLQNNYLDKDDPWSGILADTDFAVQSTYHTTLQATPGQLVFGRAMILNTPFIADREDSRLFKKKIIDKNNQLENFKTTHI